LVVPSEFTPPRETKMDKCLITGVAGFIGSHLAERLIKLGYEVIGIDCFTDYYSRDIKQKNISGLIKNKTFKFIEKNLLEIEFEEILENVQYIFHHAAQAGVRPSWGNNFKVYADNNILATQKLLEAAKGHKIKKFIYASSSSVYGDVEELPVKETTPPRPISPYGVTKLAGENLCYLYWKNFGIPIVSLRYFTVYGPGQRPDMAFHKFINAINSNQEIIIYGDGNQTRDFTYISDVVEANILAMEKNIIGEIFNIGGGTRINLNETIGLLEKIMNRKAKLKFIEEQKGDMRHTFADTTKARKMLGYNSTVGIEEGLRQEVRWLTK